MILFKVLDAADHIASIFGALVGFSSLIITIRTHRVAHRSNSEQQAEHSRRSRFLWAALNVVGVTAFGFCVLRIISIVPAASFDHLPYIDVGAAGVVMITSAAHMIRWCREPAPLPPEVISLLKAQRVEAELHQYRYWDIAVPQISQIYVEQRTEASSAAIGVGELDAVVMTPSEMLSRFRNALVVGGPGTGKSTLAAHLVHESASFWSTARRWSRPGSETTRILAVRVPAANLTFPGAIDLADVLAAYWRKTGAALSSDMFRRPPMWRVEWLFIVDGVDEVIDATARSRVLAMLRAELDERRRGGRLIVTSRALPAAELRALTSAAIADLRLRIFDPDDLDTFATRWFQARAPSVTGRSAHPQIDLAAKHFVRRVSTGTLASLVRIPLMAAMAALIYEYDRAASLPTSRTALYRQFVEVLSLSRSPEKHDDADADARPQPTAYTAETTHLKQRMPDLVEHLAVTRIGSGAAHLMRAAVEWTRAMTPCSDGRLTDVAWTDRVRRELLATSLFSVHGSDIDFVHHSLAEYLAAAVGPFDEAQWRRQMADPTLLSFGLFRLARSAVRVDPVVQRLIEDGDDPISAGHVLADGNDLQPELRHQILQLLVECLDQEDRSAEEALDLLMQVATADHELADRLADLVRNPAIRPWVRALVADASADLDPVRGADLLRQVAADTLLTVHPCRKWAARRLLARGHEIGGYLLKGLDRVPLLQTASPPEHNTALSALAYRNIAFDPRQQPEARAEAVLALGAAEDPSAMAYLVGICRDPSTPPEIRDQAADVLLAQSGPLATHGHEHSALTAPSSSASASGRWWHWR